MAIKGEETAGLHECYRYLLRLADRRAAREAEGAARREWTAAEPPAERAAPIPGPESPRDAPPPRQAAGRDARDESWQDPADDT